MSQRCSRFLRSGLRAMSVVGLLITLGGCKRAVPEQPSPSPTVAGLTVLKDGRWLFTYVDPQGQFETTDKPDIIPENVRKVVRVIDPGNTDHGAGAQVYVVDVNLLMKSGKAAALPAGREVFETA